MKVLIDRLIQDLSLIQKDLNLLLMAEVEAPSGVSAHPADLERLREMKPVIDQVRHFLWFYLKITGADGRPTEAGRELLRASRRKPVRRSHEVLDSAGEVPEYALLFQKPAGGNKPN